MSEKYGIIVRKSRSIHKKCWLKEKLNLTIRQITWRRNLITETCPIRWAAYNA